jgi:hypothetical protein
LSDCHFGLILPFVARSRANFADFYRQLGIYAGRRAGVDDWKTAGSTLRVD